MAKNARFAIVVCAVFLGALALTNFAADDNEGECGTALENARSLNANELWSGAVNCAESGYADRATFLMIVGQIRAMTDMSILEAATDEDEIKVSDLYGTLYYQMGGSGYDELYRDVNRSDELFGAVRDWNPSFDANYDPGWAYKTVGDPPSYLQMVRCQKAVRLQKLNWYAGLIRIDAYYAASKELAELQAANPGAVTVGSDVDKKMTEIMSRMRTASSGKEMPMETPEECQFAMVYEPDPDADFVHVHVGANGPENGGSAVFESEEEVTRSWLPLSLTSAELEGILGQTDFKSQILVTLSFGKRTTATGKIYFSRINYNSVLESLSIAGMIGVHGPNCDEPSSEAYPFVVAIAPRPDKVPDYPGYFAQNFPDGCKPAMTGSAVSTED